MSELDYQNPDIYWGRNPPEEVCLTERGRRTFQVGFYKDAKQFYVNAERVGAFWRCTNLLDGRLCNYAQSDHREPPIPGQHCYNCGQLRAEWKEPTHDEE